MPSRPRASGSGGATSQQASANEFTAGFERIAWALKLETQLDLARILDIRQSSISDAKRRGVIPGEWSVKLFQKYGLNPRFVYDGLPPVFLSAAREGGQETPRGHAPSFLLKYPEGSLLALRMPDSSMEPVIARDAFVGVNTDDKSLAPGVLQGLNLPLEGFSVRRVTPGETPDTAILRAERPCIPSVSVSMARARRMLLGRVVWIMGPA
jgi:hypothetical protein